MRHARVRIASIQPNASFDDRWIADLRNDLACFGLTSDDEVADRQADLARMGLVAPKGTASAAWHADLAW